MPAPSPTPSPAPPTPPVRKFSRRKWLMPVGIALNAVAGALIALPVVGYLLAPASRKQRREDLDWVSLGDLTQFPVGETRLATYRNPFVRPWDGDTGDIACWVRRIAADKLQVFAINCAHLGCPVRWFPQSGLFMCPCHGGVYYEDGSRASGPPPRGLFEYSYKLDGGRLWIKAGQMPTLASPPSVASTGGTQGCSCA
ncbi:MAG: Rieske 2Fe-2S domain-containing protein [Verrucomicrobiales bacterium]|nr:Rieske 2Fe-2S domain-containing protein [Verrucomicrobiales bacterium]